jgi:hypothetical protein
MPFFDENGRLKVTFAGPTGSSFPVYENGTLISANVTGINFVDSTDSLFNVTLSGTIAVVTHQRTPIMALSGFKDSGKPDGADFYYLPNYSQLTGSTSDSWMVGAIFKRKWSNPAGMVVSKWNNTTNQGWFLRSPGWANSNASVEVGRVGNAPFVANRQLSFPIGDNYWIYAIGIFNPGVPEIALYINGQFAVQAFGTITPTTDVPLIVGAGGISTVSGSVEGQEEILISAIAIKTGSAITDSEILVNHFNECKDAGDIITGSLINWDHIWSVKQNTPGATWADSVGTLSLVRTGSLLVVTDSNPRWV